LSELEVEAIAEVLIQSGCKATRWQSPVDHWLSENVHGVRFWSGREYVHINIHGSTTKVKLPKSVKDFLRVWQNEHDRWPKLEKEL